MVCEYVIVGKFIDSEGCDPFCALQILELWSCEIKGKALSTL